MCGRYASTRGAADLAALFEAVDETAGGLVPGYNLAPTDPVPIVRHRTGGSDRVLSVARWGLVPPWSRDRSAAARMINARAETVATSRAFRRAFAHHRCLVPADGWYEWRHHPGGKRAYFMTRHDGGVLALAGVWSAWGTGHAPVLTFSVLTVPACGDLAEVHARMPLLLPPRRWRQWLTPPAPQLSTVPDVRYLAGIEIRPVGAAVGDVRNDGPDLIRRVPGAPNTHSADPTLF